MGEFDENFFHLGGHLGSLILWKNITKIRRLNEFIPSAAPEKSVYQIWCSSPPGIYNAKQEHTQQ